ncbi:PAS domain-containing protein [Rhodopseudomonas pseudopalustris]|uniref:PAS domain-containing protein n=1 Tax=Rhodopseudomonas pseudopalustris TaxID=1513892 RepID=UPI003F99F67C
MTRQDHHPSPRQYVHRSHLGDVLVPFSALERTVEFNNLGFAKIDVATKVVIAANPKFCALVGHSHDELVGHLATEDLTQPEQLTQCMTAVRRLVREEIDSCAFEIRCIHKDGSPLPLWVTMTALERSEDNGRVLTIGIIACPRSGTPVQSGAPSSPPAAVSNPQAAFHGVSFWSYDYPSRSGACSAGFLKLLGLPIDAPVPNFRSCLAQVHPDDQMRVLSDMQRVKKGIFNSSEFRIYSRNGEMRWVNQALKPVIDSVGEVVGAVGACLDITDAKRLAEHSPFAHTVHTVRQYVDQHWDQPLSVAGLAKVAGVNSRTLFKHFKLACAHTPQEYIKHVRLNHARAMLQMADKSTTVLGTALKCCFQNQGHFARDYRLAFGERPSETLERARRRDVP